MAWVLVFRMSQETGRFAEIYTGRFTPREQLCDILHLLQGIQRSQEMAMLRSLDAAWMASLSGAMPD